MIHSGGLSCLFRAGAGLLGIWACCASGAEAPPRFYVDDIKEATTRYIEAREDEAGVFRIVDEVTGEDLQLRFVTIHDPVRVIDDNTYFACTDFHVEGEPDKLYDLDFWMDPEGNILKVHTERIHKEPRRSVLFGWYKYPRYTFVDDEVVWLYDD